ncbi:MAG: type II secretion system protein [Patescibacteria group bacterium]
MRSTGFTLIELLVASIIIITLTGAILVNYNLYNETQRARQAVLTLKNNFRFVQSRAYNGEKPDDCTRLDGYLVTFATNSYTMQAWCEGLSAGESQQVLLSKGLSFSPVPSSLLFRVLSQGLDSTVTITIVGISKSFQVVVSKSGDISEVKQL